MIFTLLFALGATSVLADDGTVNALAGGTSVTVGAKTYTIFKDSEGSYSDAYVFCESIGFKVAEIENKKENNAVINLANSLGITGQHGFWLGANQVFVLPSTGTPLTFNGFSSGEPNNEGEGEMCVALYKDNPNPEYHWNDRPCSIDGKFLCQKV